MAYRGPSCTSLKRIFVVLVSAVFLRLFLDPSLQLYSASPGVKGEAKRPFIGGGPFNPFKTGSCRAEMVTLATNALFGHLLDRGQEELEELYQTLPFESQHPSGARLAFQTRRPLDLMSNEDQRQFMAMVSQKHCPSNQQLAVCGVLGMQVYTIPAGIHAMSGGGVGYFTGGLYNADMVLEGVQLADPTLDLSTFFDHAQVLDWGGSSGRAIAMMKAAFPNCNAHVADPIRASISWVDKNLASMGIQGYASPINPPTKYANRQFKLIFAISIWSHYNFGTVALPWLQEMRRIITPDGFLVITTHGWSSVFSKVTNNTDNHAPNLAPDIYAALNDPCVGHYYWAAFPNNVDWDVDTKNPDWGMSWVDPNWLHERTNDTWHISVVLPARNDCLQDVIVLQPRV